MRRDIDSFDLETFGGRLSYAISISGKSQPDLARVLDVARSSISNLCKMQKSRTASRNVPEIARFLGVANDWLSYGMGEVPTKETLGRSEEMSFDDMDALELLTNLKPKLSSLSLP